MDAPAATGGSESAEVFPERAVRFWERGRLFYNAAQLVVCGVMVLLRWSDARFFLANIDTFLGLAFMANVLYCAVYLAEGALTLVPVRRYRVAVRWFVLISGTVLACMLAASAMEFPILRDPDSD